MANFMIRFLICNVFISGIIGILLIAKQIFKNNLSSRMQYNLWFLLLGLLAVPFIPFRLIGLIPTASPIAVAVPEAGEHLKLPSHEKICGNPIRRKYRLDE